MARVILVGPSNRFHGGISSYLQVTADGLVNSGHEVGLILLDRLVPSFIYPGKNRLNNNPVLDFGNSKIQTLHVMNYYDLSISRKIRRDIAEFDPDFAIVHWWTFAVFPMLSKVTKALRKIQCPTFIEMHEVLDQNDSKVPLVPLVSKYLGKKLLLGAHRVVVHSESDRKLVSKHFKIEQDTLTIVPLANNSKAVVKVSQEEARKKLGISQEKVVLFFGLIRKYKGVTGLIKAFERLKVPDVLLLIVGEIWDERKEIEEMINNSAKKEDIVLIDRFVDDSEIPAIYCSADSLAMPYTRASQSGVSGLAMEFGIPIVAFSVGGLEEGLGMYENSIFVESGNIEKFSLAIEESLDLEPCLPGGNMIQDVVKIWIELGNEGRSE